MPHPEFRFIKVETDSDGVTVITLNRPDRLNAIDSEMHDELDQAMLEAGRDRKVRALVITGAGQAFSSGGDISWMVKRLRGEVEGSPVPDIRDIRARNFLNIYTNIEKPIVVAVNGDAIGLGCTIALFADIIVLSENARIGDTHVRAGLAAGDGGVVIWPLLTSLCRAKEMLMTGKLLSAEEALRFGLANYVVPADQLMPTALDMARRLAKGSASAIQYTKICLNKILKDRLNLLLDAGIAMEMINFAGEDHKEAVKAFIEKRKPQFTGQ